MAVDVVWPVVARAGGGDDPEREGADAGHPPHCRHGDPLAPGARDLRRGRCPRPGVRGAEGRLALPGRAPPRGDGADGRLAAHTRAVKAAKPVIGWREWVGLPDLGVDWVKAKVDTGARSSSLHAWDIEVDGERVRFNLHPVQDDDAIVVQAEAQLNEHRDVRSSNGDVEVRPVIRTLAVLRGDRVPIDLRLS